MKDDHIPQRGKGWSHVFEARLFRVHPCGMAEQTGKAFPAYTPAEINAI